MTRLVAPSAPRTISGGRRLRLRTRSRLMGIAFIAPLVAVNLLVIAGPSAGTVFYSFTDWSGIGDAEFVGGDNYVRLMQDAEFWQALLHNIQYTLFFLVVPVAMGLLGAFLLAQITRFQSLFRVLFFLPYLFASVVNAAIWKILLDPERGIGSFVPLLRDVYFFGDPQLALPAIAVVDNWRWWGFVLVLFVTAMQSVDRSLYEAAEMDGASRWQQFWHVTIPGIRPTFVFVILMTIIGSLLVFDYVYILTNGGPGGASEVVATLMYKLAFDRFDAGYASAMGLGLSLVVGVVISVFVFLRRRGWEI